MNSTEFCEILTPEKSKFDPLRETGDVIISIDVGIESCLADVIKNELLSRPKKLSFMAAVYKPGPQGGLLDMHYNHLTNKVENPLRIRLESRRIPISALPPPDEFSNYTRLFLTFDEKTQDNSDNIPTGA